MFVSLLFLFSLQVARADQPAIPAGPVITKVKGRPVEAVWPDGNRAQLKVQVNDPIMVPLPFGMTENLCNNSGLVDFKSRFALRIDRLWWVWTQNADPKKIGQLVEITNVDDGLVKLISAIVLANGSRFHYPELVTGLPPDELDIGGAKWIPGMEEGVSKPMSIPMWLGESMVKNPETGIDENRIVSSLSGVHLTPRTGNAMTIDQIDQGSALDPQNPFLLVGDVVSWIFNVNGQTCQISFKPDLSDAQSMALGYIHGLPDTNFNDYKWAQDGLSDMAPSLVFDLVKYAK